MLRIMLPLTHSFIYHSWGKSLSVVQSIIFQCVSNFGVQESNNFHKMKNYETFLKHFFYDIFIKNTI